MARAEQRRCCVVYSMSMKELIEQQRRYNDVITAAKDAPPAPSTAPLTNKQRKQARRPKSKLPGGDYDRSRPETAASKTWLS